MNQLRAALGPDAAIIGNYGTAKVRPAIADTARLLAPRVLAGRSFARCMLERPSQ